MVGHRRDELQAATNSLAHRGPDAQRIELFSAGSSVVGLGHRRLAVIDLSHGAEQPMHIGTRWSLVFNGEIYNYRAIRQELLQRGVAFKTDSDTEVLLHAFAEWGEAAVQRFVGMFAFAIVDREVGTLQLVRDRFGVKPLYFAVDQHGVTFGSELRVFSHFSDVAKQVNGVAVSEFLARGYIGEQRSIFVGVRKVLPGTVVRINLSDLSLTERRYWDSHAAYSPKREFKSLDEAADALDDVLSDAVELRLVADVPVGLFLSGGYDSSIVAAVISKKLNRSMQSFTIGFAEVAFDEAKHAEVIARYLGLTHRSMMCRPTEAMAVLRRLPAIYDEPFGDSSAIPTFMVSELARASVTVSLSADGGDELFGGYRKYMNALRLSRVPGFVPRVPDALTRSLIQLLPVSVFKSLHRNVSHEWLAKAATLVLGCRSPAEAAEAINLSTTRTGFGREISGVGFRRHRRIGGRWSGDRQLPSGRVDQMLAADVDGYLVSDILTKVDRASMAVSLESREPLLDHRLFDFAAALPERFKIDGGHGKRVLKHLVHRYLPQEMMDRPKMGFGVPVGEWMRGALRGEFVRALTGEGLDVIPPHARDLVRTAAHGYFAGSDSDFMLLWYTYCYVRWAEQWLPR